MIKAIAIDDEPPALKIIENFAKKCPELDLLKTFTQPKEALYYTSCFPVDLMFLDIQMPSVSGIEFIKKSEQNTLVIFTTAYSEYAVTGFNLNAVDFLLKPFTLDRFKQAVAKANQLLSTPSPISIKDDDCFFIRANYSLVKIIFDNIIYIEGLDDYVKIHLFDQESVVTRSTMKNILDKLPSNDFIRIHRSFIVPVKKIEAITKSKIQVNGIEFPIGVNYKEITKKII